MEAPIILICKRLFLASVLSIAVAAPARADAARRADPVADYMQARVADADGDVATAIAGYARALAARPADADGRAEGVSRSAGRRRHPARHARRRGAAQPARRAGRPRVAPLALAAARNDAAGAEAATQALARTPLSVMVPALRAWIAYSRGGNPSAPIVAANVGSTPVAQRLAAETAALLQIAMGDVQGGLRGVQALRETGSPSICACPPRNCCSAPAMPTSARAARR
ncbi:hypothetical protein MOP88_15020 [Sphingomonas sp. WKB10]|nr:hypothetical protein [Sphingomonas sp. WKB10]